jgi:Ni2+-binding GTPase involved in maturation of urease and hydrogenase
MGAKIPVTVVTGFLGSGKTTLVRHLLQNNQGRRIAVVVNEFGEVGIDGELLRSCQVCDEDDDGCQQHSGTDQRLPVLHRPGRISPHDARTAQASRTD